MDNETSNTIDGLDGMSQKKATNMFGIRRLLIVGAIIVISLGADGYGQNLMHDDDKHQLVTIRGKVEILNHPELGKTEGSYMSLLFQYDGCKRCLFVAKTDANGNYEIGVSRGRYRVILREARGGGAPSYDLLAPDQPRYIDATSVLQPNQFDIKVVLPQHSPAGPKLLYRFEHPVSPGPALEKISESLRLLRYERDRAAFAIRLCSDDKLLPAFPSAAVDPLQIVDLIRSRYADQSSVPKIFLLRSNACRAVAATAVEVWDVDRSGNLPENIEMYEYGQIYIEQLGFDPSVCSSSKIDSRRAAHALIKKLVNDPKSYGVVIGYTFGTPNDDLRRRINHSTKLLENSGISISRYRVKYENWHADDSECSTDPVTKPSIYFLTVRPT